MGSRWQGRLARPCLAVAAAAAGVALAACGSNGPAKPAASPSHPVTSSSAQPTTGPAAATAVRLDWERFFTFTHVTIGERVGLIEDGEQLRQSLMTQVSNPAMRAITARVSRVALLSPARAKVTFTVFDSGRPVLPGQPGIAVYQDGIWKVSKQTYCQLLVLQGAGAATLPAACRNSG
jgi:hypothetical protein